MWHMYLYLSDLFNPSPQLHYHVLAPTELISALECTVFYKKHEAEVRQKFKKHRLAEFQVITCKDCFFSCKFLSS